MNILIVDDEELARLRMRSLLNDLSGSSPYVVAEAASVAQACACLQSACCDVVFLDIQMPGSNGLHLAEVLQRDYPSTTVIFVTAHAEHALRAFEINAVDYLTKPVRRERLQEALKRAAQRVQLASLTATAPPIEEPTLIVTDRGRVARVPVSQVLFLKAELKYVTVRTAQNTHLLSESLAELEPQLGARFLRVHRNALVARHAMRALERRRAVVDMGTAGGATEDEKDAQDTWAVQVAPTGEWLAVSRRQVAAVREAMAAHAV
jgi:two-component system, LytTR family, response regulator AlgR